MYMSVQSTQRHRHALQNDTHFPANKFPVMIYKNLSNGSPNSVYHVSGSVKDCVTSGNMLCCLFLFSESESNKLGIRE